MKKDSAATSHTVLIIGAGSAIATAFARRCARNGDHLFLCARDASALARQRDDLLLRGAAAVHTHVLDVNDGDDRLRQCVEEARHHLGRFDRVLLAHGSLPDQIGMAHDPAAVRGALETNALSTVRLLALLAPIVRQQGNGNLTVITSVAGDRGRASNYVYGAAKALVSTWLEGLRAELHGAGVHVMEVRPGFIDTPMTADIPKSPLWSTPDRVAHDILKGMRRRRDVIYTPFFWRYIMLVIRGMPRALFKRSGL